MPPSTQCLLPTRVYIHDWNKHNSSHIKALFEFASTYLVDNVCMFIMILEVKVVRKDVMTYAATYEFTIAKDWWGINNLPLCSNIDGSHNGDSAIYDVILTPLCNAPLAPLFCKWDSFTLPCWWLSALALVSLSCHVKLPSCIHGIYNIFFVRCGT